MSGQGRRLRSKSPSYEDYIPFPFIEIPSGKLTALADELYSLEGAITAQMGPNSAPKPKPEGLRIGTQAPRAMIDAWVNEGGQLKNPRSASPLSPPQKGN